MSGETRGGTPPSPGDVPLVERLAVGGLLDVAAARRVCVVVAAAGWGKSAAVRSWSRGRACVWLGCEEYGSEAGRFWRGLWEGLGALVGLPAELPLPEAGGGEQGGTAAAELCGRLRESLRQPLVLVLDDLQELEPGGEAVRLVEGLCRHAPELLHLVLVSRRALPFSLARLRGQGQVGDVGAPELAFDVAEVASLLRATVGEEPPGLAARVWECTGGWPAALRCAVDLLRTTDRDQRLAVLERLAWPGERLHGYVVEEVMGGEPEPIQGFLRRLSVLGEVGSMSVAASGLADAPGVLVELTRRGLVLRGAGEGARWSLVRPLADVLDQGVGLARGERRRLHAAAAADCMQRGAYAEALRHLVAAGEDGACAALLVEHGSGLVSNGHAGAVLAAAEGLASGYLADPGIQRVLGDARKERGQWTAAMECFQRAGQDSDELEPALAWRVGALAFVQGEFGEVLSLFGRTRLSGEQPADEARLLALVANAYRMTGDLKGAEAVAARAAGAARHCEDRAARAAVAQARGMIAVAEGDRRQAEAYCAAALADAEAGGDLLQALWIRLCRALHLLDMGGPQAALAQAAAVRGLAERWESPFLAGHALTICARANVRLGALESAAGDLTAAIELFQKVGSRFVAWPLAGLGDLHRVRGQVARARAAYEEALAVAEPAHDVLGMSHALVGLARTRAADDMGVALELAHRAVALGEGLAEVPAFLARGWIEVLDGDRKQAAEDAARAGAAARRWRDNPGLAEAITLSVLASSDSVADASMLGEAIDILAESGCRPEEATTRLVAGRLGARIPHLGAEAALQTLRDYGMDLAPRRVAGPLAVLARLAPTVTIRALGVFQVSRDGTPIPTTAWQSRKARDLLKILVARRRPTPRDALMELLWPEADPAKSGNRLSVLLSLLRDVLAPSHADQNGPGPLVTDGAAVWLDPTQVSIDVEEFLTLANDALAADAARESPTTTARLAAAAAAFTGDFLEDDPYQDWAAALAEEVRATHIAVLRALTRRLRQASDVDGVVRCSLRLLEQDPYDEPVHLDLVTALLEAGRPGEARRHYQTYRRRMEEMGIEPQPMPRTP